jgi:hypothetical protein
MSAAVPLSDQIKCAKREVAMRERVYARRVQSGAMKREVADYEITCMQAIVASLEALLSVQSVWL